MSIARTFVVSLFLLAGSSLAVGCSQATADTARPRTARAHADTSGSHASRDSTDDDDDARAEDDDAEREGDGAPTAMDQSNAPDDMEITRSIRAAVVSDGSLSFSAVNIVIVTNAAVVTLRGNVASNDERSAIVAHARAAPGVARVENLLAVDE